MVKDNLIKVEQGYKKFLPVKWYNKARWAYIFIKNLNKRIPGRFPDYESIFIGTLMAMVFLIIALFFCHMIIFLFKSL